MFSLCFFFVCFFQQLFPLRKDNLKLGISLIIIIKFNCVGEIIISVKRKKKLYGIKDNNGVTMEKLNNSRDLRCKYEKSLPLPKSSRIKEHRVFHKT